MFGLGWIELLVIAGVIMLFAGPAGVRKVVRTVQSLKQTKDELTGGSALDKLQKVDELLGGERDEPEAPADEPADRAP